MTKESIIKKIPEIAIALSLCIATFVPYWQVRHFDFINYDDNGYIYENPNVRAGFTTKSIAWSFSMSGYEANWHPLTWLSHILDIQLFGLKAGRHHLTNVFFHCINAVLLFLLLRLMTGAVWKSAFVAALFALHPMHVESVAWVAERKDVLSTLFWIATTFAYVWYVRRCGARRYLLVVFLFALGLMAKPMLVTLPCTLLLLDFWPLRRMEKRKGSFPIRSLLLEKTPLFFLVALSSVITFVAQQKGGSVLSLERLPFEIRIANAIVSFGTYLWKMIYPINLACIYPGSAAVAWGEVGVSLLCMGIITAISLKTVRYMPFLLVGWLWYLGTLIPVIGIVQVGEQAMADRYTYIPYIGMFIMIAWGIPELLSRLPHKKIVLSLAAAAVVVTMTAITFRQIRYWKNSIALFEHAIAITKNNYGAHNNLGLGLDQQGKIDEAITHFTEALRVDPNYTFAHCNLGNLLFKKGRIDEAIHHYAEVLRCAPTDANVHNNIGVALASQGKIDEAIAHYREALRIDPEHVNTLNNLATALAKREKNDETVGYHETAIRSDPNNFNAHNCLAKLLLKQGKTEEAIRHFSEAIRIDSNSFEAHNNLGVILAQKGRIQEAIIHFEQAIRINPKEAETHNNIGIALLHFGKTDKAIQHFKEALRLKPDFVRARKNLELTMKKANQGK
jgi:protein O-mannosyl-transferase